MRLRTAISAPYHRFLPDSVSLPDDALVDCRRVSRPRQLTDVYLLALAVEHGCRLVTFDTSGGTAGGTAVAGRHLKAGSFAFEGCQGCSRSGRSMTALTAIEPALPGVTGAFHAGAAGDGVRLCSP